MMIEPISETQGQATHWAEAVHALFKQHHIRLVAFVPDGGLKQLIERCQQDAEIHAVTLTTEEEGIALAAGAFLGGQRAALLMQSSGVGNCVNMLSLPRLANMPLFTLVTMRGEWGEFNPWQVPMGQATPTVLEASGVVVFRVQTAVDLLPTLTGALGLAFQSRCRVAVLLSQQFLGAKQFMGGDS